jgi:hypothetical protein
MIFSTGPPSDDKPLLGLVSVCHPLGEQINLRLRPWTFPSRWWRWHDGATDSADPVVDDGGVRLYVVILSEIERLAHCTNVTLCEERANIRLKTR